MLKIVMGMWVPNSERGHKVPSLKGETEIPTSLFLFINNFSPVK